MLEIRITISAPELARAVNNLAYALGGRAVQPVKPVEPVVQEPAEPVKPAEPVAQESVKPVEPNAQTYTTEQLMRAGASLMDAGKTTELTRLLRTFGVQAVMQLPAEQYGAFADALKELGANV